MALAALSLVALGTGCRRSIAQSNRDVPGATAPSLTRITVPDVASVELPLGWTFRYGQYPSSYGDQSYHMVRATFSPDDEDLGLVSIDISPSHPRLWRKPLCEHVDYRLEALGAAGDVTLLDMEEPPPEVPYETEERYAEVGGEFRTVFRIFRQRSRVVTVAYTAANRFFDERAATSLVQAVSAGLVIHLTVQRYQRPDLRLTEARVLGDGLLVQVPTGWVAESVRREPNAVPTHVFAFRPARSSHQGEEPLLTLSWVRVSSLGDADVEVEGEVEGAIGRVDSDHTVLRVDDDTLAIVRMVSVGGDIVSITYAAPDYLFDVKPAVDLVARIADSARLAPTRPGS